VQVVANRNQTVRSNEQMMQSMKGATSTERCLCDQYNANMQ
jgi:hypothetical protein